MRVNPRAVELHTGTLDGAALIRVTDDEGLAAAHQVNAMARDTGTACLGFINQLGALDDDII